MRCFRSARTRPFFVDLSDLLRNNSSYCNYEFTAASNSPFVDEYAVFTSSGFIVFARKFIISLRKIITQEVIWRSVGEEIGAKRTRRLMHA